MPAPRSRPASSPKPALDSLLEDVRLARVVERAQWFDALDRQLRPHLPPDAAAHARLAAVQGGHLVYLVDSPGWHTRLKLESARVIAAARALGVDVTALTVRIAREPLHPARRDAAAFPAHPRRNAANDAQGRALRALRELLGEP